MTRAVIEATNWIKDCYLLQRDMDVPEWGVKVWLAADC